MLVIKLPRTAYTVQQDAASPGIFEEQKNGEHDDGDAGRPKSRQDADQDALAGRAADAADASDSIRIWRGFHGGPARDVGFCVEVWDGRELRLRAQRCCEAGG